jgi:hypothetical protein
MKAKLHSIILVVAAAAAVAGGAYYVIHLEMRARRLETRLARVEAALYEKSPADTFAVVHSKTGVETLVRKPPSVLPAPRQGLLEQQRGSLEERVEKIERELVPHLELLGPVQPAPPDL